MEYILFTQSCIHLRMVSVTGVTNGHANGYSEHDVQVDPGWRVWNEGREVLVKYNLRGGQRTALRFKGKTSD